MFQRKFVEKIKIHILYSITYFFFEKRVILCDNVEKLCRAGRQQMTIWCLRIACREPKTTNTHSGCVKRIAFPLQQRLHERASILRYSYVVWLVSHLRSKNAASVHGSFHPHYSLSRCHWGQDLTSLNVSLGK